jgi:hypothetical protein
MYTYIYNTQANSCLKTPVERFTVALDLLDASSLDACMDDIDHVTSYLGVDAAKLKNEIQVPYVCVYVCLCMCI